MSAETVELMKAETEDGNSFFGQVVASLFGDAGFQTGVAWTLAGLSALVGAVVYGKNHPKTGRVTA